MLAALQRYLYSLDETPGPRDVAALVARYCPPETRRLPTHADPPTADAGDPAAPPPAGPRTARIDRDAPPDAGPRTTPVDRDAPSDAPRRARTETFATHVDLRSILASAEGASAGPASDDDAGSPADDASSPADDDDPELTTRPAASLRMRSIRPDVEPLPDPPLDRLPRPVPGRTPPSRGLLLLLSFGTLALGVAAVVVFLRGRGRHLEEPDAAPPLPDAIAASDDATPAPSPDAAPADASAPSLDAPRGLAPPDAAPRLDPARRRPRAARHRPTHRRRHPRHRRRPVGRHLRRRRPQGPHPDDPRRPRRQARDRRRLRRRGPTAHEDATPSTSAPARPTASTPTSRSRRPRPPAAPAA